MTHPNLEAARAAKWHRFRPYIGVRATPWIVAHAYPYQSPVNPWATDMVTVLVWSTVGGVRSVRFGRNKANGRWLIPLGEGPAMEHITHWMEAPDGPRGAINYEKGRQ